MEVKIYAMYLPQYHSIPENDKFWGEGFTDWVTVRNATPLFQNHHQPKIPLDDNYYDLSIKEDIKWQADLAKKYKISGWGMYHYWFNNETNLLTKPSEIIRDNKDIDVNYFFAWDNGNWKRSWSNVQGNDWAPLMEKCGQKEGPQILIPYILGEKKDWENHFNYLLSFFVDSRYVKIDGKPLFMVYNYSSQIKEMATYWDELAKKHGMEGIYVIYKNSEGGSWIWKSIIPPNDYCYNYEPIFSGWSYVPFVRRISNKICKIIGLKSRKKLRRLDYDKVWERILHNAESRYSSRKIYHGGFVNYDDTPRRGSKGTIIENGSPEKFKKYLGGLIDISKRQGKDMIFLTAWNEWGEGAYLEPDKEMKYDYLNVIKELFEM